MSGSKLNVKKNTTRTLLALSIVWSLLTIGSNPLWAQTAGWTRLGSLADRAYDIAQDPANPSALYMLGSGGISRSADAGATWSLCGPEARYMRLVSPQPGQNSPTLLYAAGSGGLRQSADGCLTWKDVSSQGMAPSSASVRWIAAYPDNNAILYAGMDGLGGLYRSVDSGASWQPAADGLPSGARVTALTADPRYPERIFVGLRYAARVHSPAYVYRSTDGGLSWRSSSLGMRLLPNNSGEITGLAWSGDTLLAATHSDGLFASTDRGASWNLATLPRRTNTQYPTPNTQHPAMPLSINSLVADAQGILIINTPEGAFRSIDGAQTWQSFGPSSDSVRLISLDKTTGQVLLVQGKEVWGYKMPSGIAALPTAASDSAQAITEPPTPPALPTPTASRATPTKRPTVQVISTPAPRPAGWLPSDKAEPLDPAFSDYFPQTGHNIQHGLRDYWLANDGQRLLGYPLTEEFVENDVTVQYFERARLEYRNKKIGWGLLGSELTKNTFFQTVRFFVSDDTHVYFGPTQHSASGPFLTFWRDNGGLTTFGFPLSESFKADGSEYQWFERARLEWHPNLPEGKRIVLGLIGKEALQKRGWIK